MKLRLKTYKKQKVPKYVCNQKQRTKKCCAKIYRKLCVRNGEIVLIMDDESYINEDPSQIKLQRYYRAESKNNIAENNIGSRFIYYQCSAQPQHHYRIIIS